MMFRKFSGRYQPFEIGVHMANDVWLIEDGDLTGVPFVEGMPNMIELATRYIGNAENGFTLRISSADFFGASIILSLSKDQGNWVEYHWNVWGITGEHVVPGRMMRSLLLRRFTELPARIYVQAIPRRTPQTQQR
jgi:hypothetical protein